MSIGGELASILRDIDYSSKKELMEILRTKRAELKRYPKKEKKQIRPLLNIAIQQAFYTRERDLLQFKKVNKNRDNNGKRKEQNSSIV